MADPENERLIHAHGAGEASIDAMLALQWLAEHEDRREGRTVTNPLPEGLRERARKAAEDT